MRNVILLIASIFVVSAFWGCSDDDPAGNSDTVYKIGVLAPLSGSASSTGQDIKAAIDIIKNSINAESSDEDIAVEYYLYDTQSDPDEALAQLERLEEEGVQIVVGPYSSASCEKALQYANENDILMISPSSVAISLQIENDNLYRFAPCDVFQAEAISAMFERDGIETVLGLVRDDVWGNDLIEAVKTEYGATALSFVYYLYSTDESGISEKLQSVDNAVGDRLAYLDADKIAVYLLSFGEGADILAQAGSYANLSQVEWYGSSAFADNQGVAENAAAGEFAAEKTLPCPIYGLDEQYEYECEPYKTQLKNELGREPSVYAFTAYDAFEAAFLALKKADDGSGEIDFAKLRNEFINVTDTQTGITGPLKLDSYGDRLNGIYDFWGVFEREGAYVWEIVARYDTMTGTLTDVE